MRTNEIDITPENKRAKAYLISKNSPYDEENSGENMFGKHYNNGSNRKIKRTNSKSYTARPTEETDLKGTLRKKKGDNELGKSLQQDIESINKAMRKSIKLDREERLRKKIQQ